jgi:hypothetical protein
MDRGRRRGLRAALANWDATAGLARRSAVYRIASRRRRAARATTCSRWRRQHQDREERLHRYCHIANTRRARRDSCSRTTRRPDVHCRRERPSADERVFRQSLPQGMPNCGRSWFGARRPQDCGNQVGECRRDRCTAGGNLRLARRHDGVSLYAGGGPTPPLAGGNAHA